MKKFCNTVSHRLCFAALSFMVMTAGAFAAAPAGGEKPGVKDGQIIGLSLNTKTGETTVVIQLGTITLPEQPKAQQSAPPAGKGPGAGQMPEIIKLRDDTTSFVLTKDTKLICGMPGQNDGQKMPAPDNKNGSAMPMGSSDTMKMPPMQGAKVSDLRIGDVLEVVYGKDGKTIDSVTIFAPLPPMGPDSQRSQMGPGSDGMMNKQ